MAGNGARPGRKCRYDIDCRLDHNIDSIQALIGRAEGSEATLASVTRASTQLRLGQDRSLIVRVVFYVYSGMIAATAIYLLYRGLFAKENIFTDFTEVLKVAVIPVVTLVIGYYFGSEKAEQATQERD